MLLYAGLISKYSTVGKPLDPDSLQDQLVQKVEYDVPLKPFASVVQLNSEYMELLDRWSFDRGYLTILLGAGIGLISYVFFAIPGIYTISPEEDIFSICFAVFVLVFSITVLLSFLFAFSRECFTYSYFPTRFNRKLRKVYVIKPNKKLLVANWDDIVFIRQYTGQGQYDLRGHILNDQGIVTDAFCLPEVGLNPYSTGMTGHWEFVRRYMESPTGAKQAYDATYKLIPLSQHRETTAETIERVYFLSKANGGTDAAPTAISNILFLIILPMNLIYIIGRRISMLTCRTPHFPQWVEDECKVDADDPYNLETHPHPKRVEDVKSFKVRVALGALYAVLIIISIYFMAGFIDMISGMKGHDTGLLRMLTFGYLGF